MTRNKNPSYRSKGLSVFLTVLMVLSIVAMSATFVGTVAATNHDVDGDNIEYGPSQNATDTIEVTFDDDVSHLTAGNVEDNLSVYAYNGSNISIDSASTTNNGYTLEVALAGDLVGGDANLEINSSITGDDTENVSIETSSQQVDLTGDSGDVITPFAGEDIAISNDSNYGDVINVDGPDGDFDQGFGQNSSVYVLDTGEMADEIGAEAGDNITITSTTDETANVTLTLRSYDINVETDESSYEEGDDITVTADADRVQRDMVVQIVDADGDVAAWTDTQSDANGEIEETLSVSNAGDYTAVVYDRSAWISGESDEFEVAEEPDLEDPEFGDIENENQGDVMEIPIQPNNDGEDRELNVTITEDNFEAQVNLTVDADFEDDEFTLDWNTYEAGMNHSGTDWEDIFSPSDGNITVDSATETNISEGFRLNSAGYTFGLYDDGDLDNRVDSASASVTERSTGEMDVWIAPNTSPIDDVDKLGENVTDSDVVAEGDYLVIEQEVSGIWGYANTSNFSEGDTGIEFSVENTEAPAYAEAESFNETDSKVSVLNDEDEDTIYFVIEVEDADLDEGDSQEWDVEFSVTEDNAYIEDEDAEESVDEDYEVVYRNVEVDLVESPYQITPTEDAEVRGSTTLAPGHEINVEVDVPGVTVDEDDVNVTEGEDGDHNWVFTHDYSDREEGEEAEITLTFDGQSDDPVDAIFNATPEWETSTDEEQMEETLENIRDVLGVDSNDEIVDAIENLQDDLSAAQDDVADLQDALDEAEGENADLQDALDQAESDLATAESDLEDAEADAQEYMTALEEAQDDLDEAEGTISDLESEVSDLEDTVSERDSTIEDLEGQVSDLEDENSDLQDQIDNQGDDDDDDDDQPAFGPIAALIALFAGGALVARRRLA